jgi:hypothetical protein
MLLAAVFTAIAAANTHAGVADDEPLVAATVATLDQKGQPKTKFWYGEPIRFQVEFTTKSKDAVSFHIDGCKTPLFPVGDGLILKHKDGDSCRVELTPGYHLTPVVAPLKVSAAKSLTRKFDFPDYSTEGGTERFYLLFPIRKNDPADPLKRNPEEQQKRWKTGLGLLPPGEFEVVFRREAYVTMGEEGTKLVIESKPITIEVHEHPAKR